jgi:hypothetical protein
MKTSHVIILTAFAAVIAAAGPLIAQEGRMLRTMPHGTYQCALPGDALGEAARVVDSQSFRITTASRYKSDAGSGTYLLRGRELIFTSGPRKGEQFKRIGNNQLQRIGENGEPEKLRCTRLGSTG